MTKTRYISLLLVFAICSFQEALGFGDETIEMNMRQQEETGAIQEEFFKLDSLVKNPEKKRYDGRDVKRISSIDLKVNQHGRSIRSASSSQTGMNSPNLIERNQALNVTEGTLNNQYDHTTSANQIDQSTPITQQLLATTPRPAANLTEPTLLPWQDWADCSETQCETNGIQQRARQCVINGEVYDEEEICDAVLRETQSCSIPCSSERNRNTSRWGEWSDWGACSVTCGIGSEQRNRLCDNQESGSCEGSSNETRLCQVPCVWWGDWNQWSSCSRTCGARGVRLRNRHCKGQRIYNIIFETEEENSTEVLKGVPQQSLRTNEMEILDLDASFCEGGQGAALESTPCSNNATCQSRWSVWGNWSTCSRSCGIGFQETHRICLGGSRTQCRGTSLKFRRCYSPPCWTAWSSFTPCSKTCGAGNGFQTRIRRCKGTSLHRPEYKDCAGERIDRRQCNSQECPVWSRWGAYGRCSKTCGGGVRMRTRRCIRGVCKGKRTSTTKCNIQRCPSWSSWTDYSCCSRTCGNNGFKERRRRCRFASGKNTRCIGRSRDRIRCALTACNVTVPSIFESFQCGYQRNTSATSGALRIFGGRVSRENRWPWQGSWQHKTCSYCDWVHFCGATLVAPLWAITASHCIEETNFPINLKNPGNSWSIVMGMHRLYKDGQRCYLKKIYIHPNYRYTEVTSADIAVMKLRTRLDMSTQISPACLPRISSPPTGATCYVTGWGYTEGGKHTRLATTLKEARIPLLSFSACRNLGWVYRSYLSRRNHMCAGNPRAASADSCTGDSGGPLICKYRDNQWYLAGITSFGFSSCGKRGHTGIYVPVHNFKSWILSTIDKDELGVC